VAGVVHPPADGAGLHLLGGVGPQQRLQFSGDAVGVQPGREVLGQHEDRHALVDRPHHGVGLGGQEKKNATSSPVVWNKQCYFSRREKVVVKKEGKEVKQQNEQLANRGITQDGKSNTITSTTRPAEYLDYAKRQAASPNEKALQAQDATVGFAGAKGDAKISQAMSNLGQASVAGVWSYQGSRPFVYNGQLFSAMGDTLSCVDPRTEKAVWKAFIRKDKDKDKELLDSVLTPPALVNDKVFVGTTFGEVRCLSAKTGEVLWTAGVGEPVVFQPAVVKGRVYVSTSSGSLYCLETGDDKDEGWLMWGANAAHNGAAK
jgi:hypothetical protein